MKPLNGTAKFWAAVASVCVSILAAGFWVITAVGTISKDVAVLAERVENLGTTVTDDRFRGSDWLNKKEWLDAEFKAVNARITILESK